MNTDRNAVKKTTLTVLIMTAATVVAKLLGLIRDVLVAGSYGTGTEAVAYETASRLPILLFDFVIGGVVTAAFIPVFSELMEQKGKKDAMRFALDYFNLVFTATLLLTLIGEIFAPQLVSLLAPDIPAEAAELAVPLTRIMFPMVIFSGLAFCFVALLQSFGHFRLPSIISLFSNGAIVLYLLFFNDRFGIYGLSFALLIGWMLQALVQLPTALRLGFFWRPTQFLTPEIRRAASAFLPVLLASWLLPAVNIINTRFASGIADGRAVTAVGYAYRFYIIIVGVFSFVATNLLFPKLSRVAVGGNTAAAKRLTASSAKLLLAVVFPVAAGCFALALPVIRIVFMRGAFTAEDAEMTAEALRWFCLGMPAMALNEVLQKYFFSRRALRAPMITSVAACAADYLFVFFLSDRFGIAGIAGAAGLAILFCAAANFLIDARQSGPLFSGRDAWELCRCCLFAVLCGMAAYFCYSALGALPVLAALMISVLAGVSVYLVLTLLFPFSELRSLLKKAARNENKS